jgi:HD-GYP domain-containing protein (c-di-GMP phosphodiesterase class II)
MNKRQVAFGALVTVAGAGAFYISFQDATRIAIAGGLSLVARLGLMALFIALMRSSFGYRHIQKTNLAFAMALTVSLVYDAALAVAAYEVSTLMTYTRDERTGKPSSVLSGSLRGLLFSDAVLILSLLLSALLYREPAEAPVLFQWPASVGPALQFAMAAAGISWALHSAMALLGNGQAWRMALRDLLLLVPCAPLGAAVAILLTMALQMEGGGDVTILCVAALLAAQRAYTRYQNSRVRYARVIATLSEAIEAKAPYAQGHGARVERCAALVGRSMGLSGRRLADLRLASRLHDIGKVGIDDIMLRKDSALDEREWRDMRKHPIISHKIIEKLELSDRVKNAILHHHERYDGDGYPQGLKMSELPIEDSILAAAAAFVAMTCERAHRPGLSVEQALGLLREGSGKQFHPDVVSAFEKRAKQLQTA